MADIAAQERAHLMLLVRALDASMRSLRQPMCRGWAGDYQINGKHGHVLADGAGYLLYITTPERDYPHPDKPGRLLTKGSKLRWNNVKRILKKFSQLTQDGDHEGCFHLDHLPKTTEAALIRKTIGIKRRRKAVPQSERQVAARFKPSTV